MKSVFGGHLLARFFPLLHPYLASHLPLHKVGKKGAAPRRQRAHQTETLGPSQIPSKLKFLHPILHHPSPVLVGCSLGLRANKRFPHIVLSVQHLAFPILVCLAECLLVLTVLQRKTKAKLLNNAVMASPQGAAWPKWAQDLPWEPWLWINLSRRRKRTNNRLSAMLQNPSEMTEACYCYLPVLVIKWLLYLALRNTLFFNGSLLQHE